MMDEDEDYLDWSDDDLQCSSKYVISSDEDEDFLLMSMGKSKAKKVRGVFGRKNKNDEEDFETEMASELSVTMRQLASAFIKNKTQGASSSEKGEGSEKRTTAAQEDDSQFYDDVYFDSDDSDPEGIETTNQPPSRKRQKPRHRVMTNDELFYDPTLDDQDQEWVNKQRRAYQVKAKRGVKGAGRGSDGKCSAHPSLPHSDAVLNCAACLTTLCMDCQRHEIYHNQYRAMFVFNCTVNTMESLKFPSKNQKKKEYFKNKKKKKERQGQEASQSNEAEIAETYTQDTQAGNGGDVRSKPRNEENEENMAFPAADTTWQGQEASQSKLAGATEAFTQPTGGCGKTQSNQPPELNEENVASPPVDSRNASLFKGGDSDDVYHPVMCKICNTKVAVYDKDEVYHFFNVVTSY